MYLIAIDLYPPAISPSHHLLVFPDRYCASVCSIMHLASGASALALFALCSKAAAEKALAEKVSADVACPYEPQWGPCQGNVPDGIDCASMDVPKDWTDETKARGHITLRLVRRRATVPDEDVDGAPAIIINPGFGLFALGIYLLTNSSKWSRIQWHRCCPSRLLLSDVRSSLSIPCFSY